ncbi:hypothetical protein MMPV_006450 [Pyropia vietnamensis]
MAVHMLSQVSRHSHLTPYALMVLAEAFLLVAALVVFGGTWDMASTTGVCKVECIYGIVSSIGATVSTGVVVMIHLTVALAWLGDRLFSLKNESRLLTGLLVLWIPTVSCLSTVRGVITVPEVIPRTVVRPTSGSGLVFSWLFAFVCVYANWQAYHASKEEEALSAAKERAEMIPEEEETFANFS